ncbi:MAG: hypothetical protein HYZ75_08875 [Elusimicrobia bacterium]|nr:hypothetical protein [Elusimicrobiota bacterium]
MPDDESEDVETGKLLAASDLSRESRVRESLKRRLVESARGRSRFRPAPPLLWAAGLAGVLVVLYAAMPVSATLRTFFSRWFVGPRTEVGSFVPERIATAEARPRTWVVQTTIGNFSGDVPVGAAADLRFHDGLDGARSAMPGLYAPRWVPAGYAFESAVLTPLGGAIFVYLHGGTELVVYQTPSRVRHVVAAEARRVRVAGTPAAWVDGGYGLVWEKDGMSFNVGGRTLVLEDALRLAESLRKEAL